MFAQARACRVHRRRWKVARGFSAVHRLRDQRFGPSNLDLDELDVGLYSAPAERLLVPAGQRGRVFGGQIIGQALHAASLTAPDRKRVHSIHAYFLRAGRTDRPIVYLVDRVSDGRSFATRSVKARQAGECIFTCQASFQAEEHSDWEHTLPMPEVPMPEDLQSVDELCDELRRDPRVQGSSEEAQCARAALEAATEFVRANPIEVKHASFRPDVLERTPPAREPVRSLWMRTRLPLGDDPRLHQCAAAFFSDWSLLTTALLPHRIFAPGLSGFTRVGLLASLDHSMWFHSPFRADEWLLYHVVSPRSAGGRALCSGQIFTRDGALCASTAQEGLIRKKRS